MDLGIHSLAVFVISGLLLNITPGPDSLLIMTRSASQGWRAGSAAALGIGAGTFLHILAAALGLSAVLSQSALAFTLVKILGAAYLLYLGVSLLWQNWRQPRPDKQSAAGKAEVSEQSLRAFDYRRVFLQGFWTNLLNPKVALFFLAFVPQFIATNSTHKAWAFILLGCIFNFNGMLWCHFLAVVSARASRQIQLSTCWQRLINSVIGLGFVALSLKLLQSQRQA